MQTAIGTHGADSRLTADARGASAESQLAQGPLDAQGIGRFLARPRALMAPMAGVSDAPFRTLAVEHGADLAFCEMVSALAIVHGDARTKSLLAIGPRERWVGVQLFGHDAAFMARAAAWVEEELGDALAWIDVNMGCPARKIVSKGDGAALMRDQARATSIVRAVVSAVSCGVTVKMRLGYEWERPCAVELAQRLEQAGAAAIAVHGRYAVQGGSGPVDVAQIGRVCRAVSIPVIGNGGVRTADDALNLVQASSCAAVMVARGALGNPWVFADIAASFAGGKPPTPPTMRARLHMAARHARLLAEQDEGRGLVRMRKHAMWYVQGMPQAAAVRARITRCSTLADFEGLFAEYEARLEHVS